MKNAVHKTDVSFPGITWLRMLPEQQKTKAQTKTPQNTNSQTSI